MRGLILFVGLLGTMLLVTSCSNDCMTCEGISAPAQICKGDFQETADYNAYVAEYIAQGGTCTEN